MKRIATLTGIICIVLCVFLCVGCSGNTGTQDTSSSAKTEASDAASASQSVPAASGISEDETSSEVSVSEETSDETSVETSEESSEASSDEPSSDEPSSDEPSSDEPSSDEPSSEDPSSEDSSSEDPSSEIPDGWFDMAEIGDRVLSDKANLAYTMSFEQYPIGYTLQMFIDGNKSQTVLRMSVAGETSESVTYLAIADGGVYQYMQDEDGNWICFFYESDEVTENLDSALFDPNNYLPYDANLHAYVTKPSFVLDYEEGLGIPAQIKNIVLSKTGEDRYLMQADMDVMDIVVPVTFEFYDFGMVTVELPDAEPYQPGPMGEYFDLNDIYGALGEDDANATVDMMVSCETPSGEMTMEVTIYFNDTRLCADIMGLLDGEIIDWTSIGYEMIDDVVYGYQVDMEGNFTELPADDLGESGIYVLDYLFDPKTYKPFNENDGAYHSREGVTVPVEIFDIVLSDFVLYCNSYDGYDVYAIDAECEFMDMPAYFYLYLSDIGNTEVVFAWE